MNNKDPFSPPKRGTKKDICWIFEEELCCSHKGLDNKKKKKGKLEEEEEQVLLERCWTLKVAEFTEMIHSRLDSKLRKTCS